MRVSPPRRLPPLTEAQQRFILTHLAAERPYAEICALFLEAYADFGMELPSDIVLSRLYDTIRKLKRSRSEEISEIGQQLIRSKDPEYRFRVLDKLLHETPDVEVIYSTPEGVEKKQCNRAVKVKIIELMERIDGTFDNSGADTWRTEKPEMVKITPGHPFYAGAVEAQKEMERYKALNPADEESTDKDVP